MPGNSAVSLKTWGFHALTCYFAPFKPRSLQTSTLQALPLGLQQPPSAPPAAPYSLTELVPTQGTLRRTPCSLQEHFCSSGKYRQNLCPPEPITSSHHSRLAFGCSVLRGNTWLLSSGFRWLTLALMGLPMASYAILRHIMARVFASLQKSHSLWAEFEWAP